MKKVFGMVIALIMIPAVLTACASGQSAQSGRQVASAYLDQDSDAVVEVMAELTGGWSAEFARGAAYLYDEPYEDDADGVGMLVTLEKGVYEEYLAEAADSGDRKEADGGVYYTDSEGRGIYLVSLDDKAFVMVTTDDKADIETAVSRLTLKLDQ